MCLTTKIIIVQVFIFVINLNLKNLRSDKDRLFRYLNKKNIFPQFHYKPLNMYSFYKKKELYVGAEKYFKSSLSIPLYYGIKKNEQKYILKNIKKFINDNKIINWKKLKQWIKKR